ncbi:MAG: medium chain dehydrogenase/reductase family protein [Kovacikia sp.]
MKYKRVVITRIGGPEVLQMVENEVPEPKAGEVRVKILATGAALTDVLMREGLYPGVPKLPYSPGYDIVGWVDKQGPGVSLPSLGECVLALTVTGGYSEFICLPAADLISVPAGVDPIKAVCLVLHYVTAEQMLHRVAQVKPGQKILIHGAAGGVGTALLQLGKLAGLEMYGTASKAKHALVEQLGGIPIDYKNEDFVSRVRNLTGDGVDVVFDAVGGPHLWSSYKTLRPGGKLVSYGAHAALASKGGKLLKAASGFVLLGLFYLIPDGRKTAFYSIETFKKQHPNWFREDLTNLLDLLAHGQIQPVIAQQIPLAEAAQAHEWLDKAAVQGQIVLLCHGEAPREKTHSTERTVYPPGTAA